jgi:hypothetical protein
MRASRRFAAGRTRTPLPAFNYVPRYSVDFALPLRGNVFDNVVVVKARRMHETQFYDP